VRDLYELALKIERLAKMSQQSALLLMIFGLAVACMWFADFVHLEVLALFTMCAYVLLRWGLPRQ